jgi:hypothetical protein
MSEWETILELVALAALSSYLDLKHRQRERKQSRGSEAWTGQGIDVTKLQPTVEDTRRAYVAARRSTRGVFVHRSLLGLARHTVVRLAYFRDRESEEHSQAHGP